MTAPDIEDRCKVPFHVAQAVGQLVGDFPVQKIMPGESRRRAVAMAADGFSIEQGEVVGHAANISRFVSGCHPAC